MERLAKPLGRCAHLTTWTTLQHDGPNHLGLSYNAVSELQMALITSDCVPVRATSGARGLVEGKPGAVVWHWEPTSSGAKMMQ